VRGGVAIVASAMTLTSVYAGGVGNMSCVGGPGSVNCVGQWGPGGDPNVRVVPQALGDEERAQAAVRERKWLAQAIRSFDAILTVLRAISMRRAAANTALARIRAQSFQTDLKNEERASR
jgi:hypothetical protein